MKQLAALLAKKEIGNRPREVGEKDVENIFFEVLKEEFPNIAQADIQGFKFRDKKIFLMTAHPAIASEIWRKRERLKNKVNDFLRGQIIDEIKVK